MIAGFAMLALACLLSSTSVAQSPHAHRHSFADAEKWARIFDDAQRDEWQKP
jgi:hypothetical protein